MREEMNSTDREFKIACGSNRNAYHWLNETITWEALCERLSHAIRTDETVEQYQAMSREQRSAIKDKGGLVGGHLKGSRRLAEEMESRTLLILDADHIGPGFIDSFIDTCPVAAAIYTTHSHTPLNPRARIVIPLAEDISPDAYPALARHFADQWGIDQFDECSYRVNQLMYWPSCPKDGEYICRIKDGPLLDAGRFLSAFPDWWDPSTLPVSSREKPLPAYAGKHPEDPLTKDGIVGAFCRTYSVEAVLERFLSDVYAPSVKEGRYDYTPGEGTAGVIVVDEGRFAFSFHGTDPAQGHRMNAFDLVRVHRFAKYSDGRPMTEEDSFRLMCEFAGADPDVQKTLAAERQKQAVQDFEEKASTWEDPLPFGRFSPAPFPLDALPPPIANYADALSKNVQAPVDMAGCAALATIATAVQGKFVIRTSSGWQEQLCLYQAVIALPSERKSAMQQGSVKPIGRFERKYNQIHAAEVETSAMQRRVLERRQKAIEDQLAKGKATDKELKAIAREITDYQEAKPLRLFVDDITTEKLASVLAENNGRMAILSSEAGIFDTLAGTYSKSVNIDVMLKSYTGDEIRVDRIGREAEAIAHPALTILLMAQPSVISKVMSNKTFRGRGLTARFLYSMPESTVGHRKFRTPPIPNKVYEAYEQCIFDMLQDPYPEEPEVITLSPEAEELLEAFYLENEPKHQKEFAEFADWTGKLAGNTLRIAGLLCRASVTRALDFMDDPEPLQVDKQTMENAIRIGRYFLNHAQAVFDSLPEDAMFRSADRLLCMMKEKKLKEFSRREAMRNCSSFKTVDEIQPVLDFLEDYGYIAAVAVPKSGGKGRPPMPKYLVNPWVGKHYGKNEKVDE